MANTNNNKVILEAVIDNNSLNKVKKEILNWAQKFFNIGGIITKSISYTKESISNIKVLDTALANLRNTANMSAKELENFYYTSNNIAKQTGVTTKEIIDLASAWSRLGFNTSTTAAQMAKLSAQLKLISPGITSDEAISGLNSIMKAYDINVSNVLDGIISKINIIGSKFAVSNADIISMLQDSVSAMAEGNNTLEETIALETAAFEIAQNRNVGDGFTALALRLRGINEETGKTDEALKTIADDIFGLTGVSVMSDINTYKSIYQILKDISEVWSTLTDNTQAETLDLMFGKNSANIGSSVLENFEAVDRAMNEMANSAGNAGTEIAVAMDSIENKMNRLEEIGTGIAQNLFDRDDVSNILDIITSLGEGIDWLTGKLGLFGTIGAGAGLLAGIKNVGMANYISPPSIICLCCLNMPTA